MTPDAGSGLLRYRIYGAGAIGAAIGALLYRRGHEVVLIARGEHYEVLKRSGLRFATATSDETLRIPVAASPAEVGIEATDVIVMAMKSQDTHRALTQLAASVGPDVTIACAQNGVENERLALRWFRRVYALYVTVIASHLAPGEVLLHTAPVPGIIDVGRYPSGSDELARCIAADLENAGFSSQAVAEVMPWKYAKLLSNLGNAVEVICGPQHRGGELHVRARAEAVACYAAAGIEPVSDDDRLLRSGPLEARVVAGRSHEGSSSWQSLQRATGSIEADYLNGEIALLGRLHGVATPVNDVLQRVANRMAWEGTPAASFAPEQILTEVGV